MRLLELVPFYSVEVHRQRCGISGFKADSLAATFENNDYIITLGFLPSPFVWCRSFE